MSSFILLLVVPAVIAIILFRKKTAPARTTEAAKPVSTTDQLTPDSPIDE